MTRPFMRGRRLALALGVAILGSALGLLGLSLTERSPAATNDRVALLLTSDAGRKPSPAELDEAERLTRQSLKWTPAEPAMWARLSYIEVLRHNGALDAKGVDLLKRSYALSPIDPGLAPWRTNFVFEHWTQADKTLRRLASVEAATKYASGWPDPDAPPWAAVNDPAGRFALQLVLDRPVKQQVAGAAEQ